MEPEKKKILLHACCAVCFGYPAQLLKFLKYEVVGYFYNPNIYPQNEFQRRKEELEAFCAKYNFELHLENYTAGDFAEISKGLEKEAEKGLRCQKCFELRLEKTAKKAKELGIKAFSTTLSVSAHKNSSQIFEAGQKIAQIENVAFEPFDFKKNNGTKITNEIAKFNNLYRQNYCGCEFSQAHLTKKN